MHTASTRALGASAQANAVASAFETAKSAMINPEAIAANRNAFVQLVRSNFLGLNGPMIAAAEGIYEEFWAADVAAMFGYYGGASAAAGQLASWSQALQGLPGIGQAINSAAATAAAVPANWGFGNLGASNIGSGNNNSALPNPLGGATPGGAGNFGSGNLGGGNIGSGNKGTANLGNGNWGNWNIGSGNRGTGNIGFGNSIQAMGDALYGNNIGIGNLGASNWGLGNNGVGNQGGGNTGSWNIGLGLTGDHLFGIGGTHINMATGEFSFEPLNGGTGNIGFGNSGTNNIGFFNSGDGNVGMFSSGFNLDADKLGTTQGFGIGNTGYGNIGIGNSAAAPTYSAVVDPGNPIFPTAGTGGNFGFGNSGALNTGFGNAGGFNTGNGNAGDFNTGDMNSGNTNTWSGNSGWFNTGFSNAGWGNTGNFFATDITDQNFISGSGHVLGDNVSGVSGYNNTVPDPGFVNSQLFPDHVFGSSRGFSNVSGFQNMVGEVPYNGANPPYGSNGAVSGIYNAPTNLVNQAFTVGGGVGDVTVEMAGFASGIFNNYTLAAGYFDIVHRLQSLTG
ncbi:PPE family protein [Mycobacterium sp.]|uniref:PPE family protein n=1 Tax=Mycobacterium sp. TaxID=1785 RepID=UPI003A873784